jgi:myo-inositol 2-dehydrogenase / D-chiro-inositol 1-dehydrogenase
MKNNKIVMTRRDIIKTASVSAAVLASGSSKLFAAGHEELKIALVGCGGRGNGALKDHIAAAESVGTNVKIVALADFFLEKAKATAKEHGVSEDICYGGASGYKKVMSSGADVVLLVTPPNFRPLHLEAAVEAGMHVFMEKPVAVDAPGARRIIAAGEKAKAAGLSIVAGTQRRHQGDYLRTYDLVQKGAIGEIKGGEVYWCGEKLWHRDRNEGESDASYLVRNWVNFTEMSGDHIVEQHVHNIDVANWFIGRLPVAALGFGSRSRRVTGNQYDSFSVDFDYGDGVHIHSMCRQINGCYNRVAEHFVGTKGDTWASNAPKDIDPAIKPAEIKTHENPYVQEHIDLLNAVKSGKPINEAYNVAASTMCGIMGRISAYTGQMVRMSDLMTNEQSPFYSMSLKLTAEDFETGNVFTPQEETAPLPGEAWKPA